MEIAWKNFICNFYELNLKKINKFSFTFLWCGFKSNYYDHALFIHRTGKGCAMLLPYVDDMVITRDDVHGTDQLKCFLSQSFDMQDVGHLSYRLG